MPWLLQHNLLWKRSGSCRLWNYIIITMNRNYLHWKSLMMWMKTGEESPSQSSIVSFKMSTIVLLSVVCSLSAIFSTTAFFLPAIQTTDRHLKLIHVRIQGYWAALRSRSCTCTTPCTTCWSIINVGGAYCIQSPAQRSWLWELGGV